MPRTMLTDIQWELLLKLWKVQVVFTIKLNIEWHLKEYFIEWELVFLGEIYHLNSENGAPFTGDLIFGQRKMF